MLSQLARDRRILEEVVARVPLGVALLRGADHRFDLVNRRYLDLLPPGRDDVIGRSVAEVAPEAAAVFPLLDRVLETGERVEQEDFAVPFGGAGAWLGNRYYTFSYDPVPDDDGRVGGVLVTAVETTERVRRERELADELDAEHEVATTLQRALLPAALPTIPGASMAALYRAAGQQFEVGGDFYDSFENRDGSFTLLVGDMCGKGPTAAAQTAMVRYTLRAYSAETSDPGLLLALVNDEMLRHAPEGPGAYFCTAVCGRVALTSAGGLSITFACAGHPPPLLLRDAGYDVVATGGTMLGAVADERYPTVTANLLPGDALVLYTDGVLEARAPESILTPEQLAASLAPSRLDESAAIALAAERAALRVNSHQRDDIAILVLTADDQTEHAQARS